MKKILFIANTDRHIKLCHIPYLKMFHDNGYIVHVATNTDDNILYCDKKINLCLKRNPFSFSNIKALFKIRKIVYEEKYDLISCHTPVGGFLGRCSIIRQNLKTKVFYTAHGFHFYKGSNFISWLLYYHIEKYLSKYTTCLFTVNKEDYHLSKEKFYCDTYRINGIGCNLSRLKVTKDKDKFKKELGLNNYFVVTYIAEISKRKNQLNLIKKLNLVDLEKENIKVLLVGDSIIKNFSKRIHNKNIIYIDFKENVGDYLNISDLIISSSIQEGMPLCILEAMYFNKYVIALNIRGNRDLITSKNGLLVNNIHELIDEIIKYKNNGNIKVKNNIDKYLVDNVIEDVKKIYNKYLDDKLN